MSRNPRVSTANELVKRQARGGAQGGHATREVRRRTQEFSDQAAKHRADNPERYQTVSDPGFFPGDNAGNTKMSPRAVYRAMDYGSSSEATSHQDHPTLPGVGEHVDRLYKKPARSSLTPEQNAHIEKQAAMFGVTRDSATQAAAAHIDQSFRRDPDHHSFYTAEGQDATGVDHPRERVLRSAKEAGVPPPVHAMANAITSPRVKFAEKRVNPETGVKDQVQYTNDDNARQASIAGKKGGDAVNTVTNLPGRAGFTNRTRAAAKAVDEVLNQGKTIHEAWSSASPKTGPFHNSWVDPNGPDQRWTADTHSGAPLVAPHLKGDEQKMAFMSIPGVHQWIHERATDAMGERGLSSVSGTQSAHWNLQREQSEASGNRALVGKQHIHNGSPRATHDEDVRQGRLF